MSKYSSFAFSFKKMFLEVVLFVAVSLSSAAADNVESERPLLALILHCSQPGASHDAVCPDACRRWPQYCYYAIAAEYGVPGTCKLPPYPRVGDYSIETIELAGAGQLADFTLHYTCPPGYKLNGYHPSCVSGTWYADFPSCTSVSLSSAAANNVESELSKCVLPPYPEHGSYSLVGRAAPPAWPGLRLDAASLTVTCDPPYRPDGPADLHCFNGQWYTLVPQCKRFCNLTPHPSVTYSCKPTDPNILSGDRKCNDFEPSGTEVHPRCNDNYYHNGVLRYMNCIEGSWDNVATCELECGTLTPNGESLVINGVSAKRGEFPWHAGIYDKRYHPFMQICGGSIVSTTVIISAAHCFWNDDVERVQPAKYFAVGVGKLYRSWNIDEGGQKSDVKALKVPPRFLGVGLNFQDDIALVILVTPIVLANYVRPVCIDFNVLFNERQLQPGNVGKVAGWGLTSEDGNASPVLKVKELPYVDVELCITDLYITSDKICAGTKTGSALCKGDSGGGLVFPEVERGVQRWYLRGVASTRPNRSDHKCNMNSYTLFTQLLKHEDIVRKHLNNSVSSPSSAAANNVESKSSKCVLPPFPEHGSYSLVGRAGARPGLALDAASLTVTCDAPYRPDGPVDLHCYNGQWYTPVPQCKRFCKLTPHLSVTYSCKLTDPNILSGDRKCNDFEPSGTEVHPRCNDNYRYNGVLRHMQCIDGSWDSVATCEPECGTLTPNGEPLVINSVTAKRGELPWHAGIYDKRYTPFMQICGGSLVSTTVIISAAHCFWNDLEHVLPAKYFAVGVGKLYRAWNIDEGGQKCDVSDLKVPPRFLGVLNNYQDDIALVILVTPIVLANYVRPVCIDFNALFDERQLQPGNVGKVAGWGLTSEDVHASQVLKVTELPYVDVEQCIADLPFDFRSYITSDKICAGTKTGSALCKGDSGGGLVFPKMDGSVQRWYLRGLASTAPSNGHKCNANSYSVFTHLLKHENFVRNFLNNR